MSTFEIKMPKMGESVQEATITKWFVEKGQMIEEDEPILEIATDKVDSEVPSPVEGKVIDIRFSLDDVVPVGEVVAVIDLTGEADIIENSPETNDDKKTDDNKEGNISKDKPDINQVSEHNDLDQSSTRFYSPLVKNIAQKENVSFEELEKINGSGKNGRVQKKDILNYIENLGSQPISQPTNLASSKTQSKSTTQAVKPSVSSGDEIIQMDRMRKVIAERMVNSKHTAAHVTSMVEADVENLVQWRNSNKTPFQQREGIKLTFMPMFIEAVSKALKDFPLINVAVDGDTIIKKKDHNIGIAVALPSNNLIVPVIKKADHKNITGLAHELNDLASRARENKLSMDEIEGGTFSITNFGSFGNVMGTPILNQPESAILAVGTIEKKPAVVETEYGDIIVPRHKMFLSLTYDHRVIDGALGGAFVRRVADYLEQFDKNRTL
jgi:2-oxoglutarate dehydrogenase E2 component (dihydrolipoamide succinyltransferase)